MAQTASAEVTERGAVAPLAAILDSLPIPVLVLDHQGCIEFVNPAAEQFLGASALHLAHRDLADILTPDSPLLALIAQVTRRRAAVFDYGVEIDGPRFGPCHVNIHAAPMSDIHQAVIVALEDLTTAQRMDRHLTHRTAARSVSGMAAVLAHEIKNPLSGIRGAAQLLERNAAAGDRRLARLIRDEVDRICALVDRMEEFSDRPLMREPVNIHEVLERVRQIAQTGFAAHVEFVEHYDPSLPSANGNFNQLVQVFLNLVKNAAEAMPEERGEITVSTAYRHGLRLETTAARERAHLPLEVGVGDNGKGIATAVRRHLFDPFVTTKPSGAGLGLALVAKIIDDHGGMIEFDSGAEGTTFLVRLPVYEEQLDGA